MSAFEVLLVNFRRILVSLMLNNIPFPQPQLEGIISFLCGINHVEGTMRRTSGRPVGA